MASNPLVFADLTRVVDTGKEVSVHCREPQSCMSGRLQGPSAVVHAAMERLEAIHQAAHALKDEVTG